MKLPKLFKREYYFDFHVQFDENKKPCICGVTLKWLDLISIEAYNRKTAEDKAFEIIECKYPKYKGFIQYL